MAAAHKRCSLVFVHKIDGILKIQCRIKMKKGRWNVPFHYELRFTDSGLIKIHFHGLSGFFINGNAVPFSGFLLLYQQMVAKT